VTREYTVLALLACAAVIAAELIWLRTGLLRRKEYWLAIAIVLGFQVLVDGWLTRPSAEIVSYHPAAILGVRAPWHIPVEDFAFGFALVTLTLLLWERSERSDVRSDS
jgi:lycopene cyclase domain-containing protein